MRTYSIITKTNIWSLGSLVKEVEAILNEKTNEGFEIVTVSFGTNLWWFPTAYINFLKAAHKKLGIDGNKLLENF